MTNPAWGTKRCCQSCGVKYYDLNRAPILCPKCGVELNLASSTRLRSDPTYKPSAGRARSVFGPSTFGHAAPSGAAAADPDAMLAEEADETEEEGGEDEAEDVSELDGDDDDLAEIAQPEER